MVKVFTFVNNELGELKVLVEGGKPYFLGNNVASILGYSMAYSLVYRYISKENKLIKKFNFGTGMRRHLFLNKKGLYEILHNVKTVISYDFDWWLTSEVFPEINKYIDRTNAFCEKCT